MKKIINLTRHDVTLKQLGRAHHFEKSGKVARITESSNYIVRDELLLKEIGNQRLVGLPLASEDTFLLVSRVVAEHARKFVPNLSNLVFPDDLIIENGKIIGCRSLGVLL